MSPAQRAMAVVRTAERLRELVADAAAQAAATEGRVVISPSADILEREPNGGGAKVLRPVRRTVMSDPAAKIAVPLGTTIDEAVTVPLSAIAVDGSSAGLPVSMNSVSISRARAGSLHWGYAVHQRSL